MFNTKLMAHQQCAIKKLSRLKAGALFMDMGTGKTRTYLELGLNKVQDMKASHLVIICPVSGMDYLAQETFKHTGKLATIHRGDYSDAKGQVNIIGTESMSSSIKAVGRLTELCRDAVVIQDESHQIKNKDAARSRRIIDAVQTSRYRYISSGTPMSNGVEDLWNQCQFLSPLINEIVGAEYLGRWLYYAHCLLSFR
jgi:hypothetical protein